MTIYSLSEIEAQCKKAVHGAGFAWGYAEEVAKAVRYLAAHQLPGAVVLANYLAQRHDAPQHYVAPLFGTENTVAKSADQRTCPVLSGAALCDGSLALAQQTGRLHGQMMAAPLLLLPYLAVLSRQQQVSLSLQWSGGVQLVCHQGRVGRVMGNAGDWSVAMADSWECRFIPLNETEGAEAGVLGQEISGEVWRGLDRFAQLTYVPATEASRRGAGPAD